MNTEAPVCSSENNGNHLWDYMIGTIWILWYILYLAQNLWFWFLQFDQYNNYCMVFITGIQL